MEHITQYDLSTGVCTVTVTGEVRRPHDSVKLQQLARDFGVANECDSFLFDLRHAKISTSTVDTFETGTVPADENLSQQGQTIALVYSGDVRDHKFLETVAVNRGYNVRVFDDLDVAREWLTSSTTEASG